MNRYEMALIFVLGEWGLDASSVEPVIHAAHPHVRQRSCAARSTDTRLGDDMTEKTPIGACKSGQWLVACGMAVIIAAGCATVMAVLHASPIVTFYAALAVAVALTPMLYAAVVRQWVEQRGLMRGLRFRRASADRLAEPPR